MGVGVQAVCSMYRDHCWLVWGGWVDASSDWEGAVWLLPSTRRRFHHRL